MVVMDHGEPLGAIQVQRWLVHRHEAKTGKSYTNARPVIYLLTPGKREHVEEWTSAHA